MNFDFDASELMKIYRKALGDAYCKMVDDTELNQILNERGINGEETETQD